MASITSETPRVALESDRAGFVAVSPDDDLRHEPSGLGVLRHVIGLVVEGMAEARELGVDTVRGEHTRVDGRQNRIPHAVAPREVAKLSCRVAGAPLALSGGQ